MYIHQHSCVLSLDYFPIRYVEGHIADVEQTRDTILLYRHGCLIAENDHF